VVSILKAPVFDALDAPSCDSNSPKSRIPKFRLLVWSKNARTALALTGGRGRRERAEGDVSLLLWFTRNLLTNGRALWNAG